MFIAYTASNLHATWYEDGKWPKRHRTRRLGPMVSVFFFHSFLLILMIVYCIYSFKFTCYVVWRQVEGCDDGKWPKRRRTRHLGPMVSVFFFPFVFIDTNACLLHIQLLIYKLREMEGYDYGKGPKRPSFVPLVTTLSFFSFHIF